MRSIAVAGLVTAAAAASMPSCDHEINFGAELLEFYYKILTHEAPEAKGVTPAQLATVMQMHDSDMICDATCMKFASDRLSAAFDSNKDGLITLPELIDANPVKSVCGYDPVELRLALTGSNKEMKAMWITSLEMAEPTVTFVRVDEEGNAMGLPKRIPAAVSTYTVPKKWWPIFTGRIYDATMTGLVPGARYRYTVSGKTDHGVPKVSEEQFFHAPPALAAGSRSRWSVTADVGTYMPLGWAVMEAVGKQQDALGLDGHMVVGDISYAGIDSAVPRLDIEKDDEFSHIWDLYGLQTQAMSSSRPFMVAAGNHDAWYDNAAVLNRYHMPAAASGGSWVAGALWYSYDYGNTHWVVLGSESDTAPESAQWAWLDADLSRAAANRATVPWVVVTTHKPFYASSSSSWMPPNSRYQRDLEPLLTKYGVDVTFTGHMHCYERIHPAITATVTDPATGAASTVTTTTRPSGRTANGVDVYEDAPAPVHVVVGNAGAFQAETWEMPHPEWSAVRYANGFDSDRHYLGNYTDTFGFGVLDTVNATHAMFEYRPLTGGHGDAFWIVRRH